MKEECVPGPLAAAGQLSSGACTFVRIGSLSCSGQNVSRERVQKNSQQTVTTPSSSSSGPSSPMSSAVGSEKPGHAAPMRFRSPPCRDPLLHDDTATADVSPAMSQVTRQTSRFSLFFFSTFSSCKAPRGVWNQGTSGGLPANNCRGRQKTVCQSADGTAKLYRHVHRSALCGISCGPESVPQEYFLRQIASCVKK